MNRGRSIMHSLQSYIQKERGKELRNSQGLVYQIDEEIIMNKMPLPAMRQEWIPYNEAMIMTGDPFSSSSKFNECSYINQDVLYHICSQPTGVSKERYEDAMLKY